MGNDLTGIKQPNRGRPRDVQNSCGLLRRDLGLGSNDLDGRPIRHGLQGCKEAVDRAVGDLHRAAAADAEFDGLAVAERVKRLTGKGLVGGASHVSIVRHQRNKRKPLRLLGQAAIAWDRKELARTIEHRPQSHRIHSRPSPTDLSRDDRSAGRGV